MVLIAERRAGAALSRYMTGLKNLMPEGAAIQISSNGVYGIIGSEVFELSKNELELEADVEAVLNLAAKRGKRNVL